MWANLVRRHETSYNDIADVLQDVGTYRHVAAPGQDIRCTKYQQAQAISDSTGNVAASPWFLAVTPR